MFKLLQVWSLFLIVCDVHSAVIITAEGPLAETNVGPIRGLRSEDDTFSMFMGVPYAFVNQSNVFGNAIPYPPFDQTFEAVDDSAICPQVEEFNGTITGSLDCLHLNIYVPDSATPQSRLPVMTYIHGGEFVQGFGGRFLYSPEYLVRHDVILVVFNYRLGVYGFMCLDSPEVPGNSGLKDQVMALRWIRDNIEAFGGDPDQVTWFGNSAGGMSGALHLVSENEKLFNKMITQSGSSFHPNLFRVPNNDAALQLAANLGLVTNDLNEALQYIGSADEHSVIEAATGILFRPCLEHKYPGVEEFLLELPHKSNHSKAADVTFLVGYNSDEALTILPSESADPNIWAVWESFFQSSLNSAFNFNETQITDLVKIVKRFYIGDDDVNNDTRQQVLDFRSDLTFVYSTIRSINVYLNAGADKVYQYLFSYQGNRNFVRRKNDISAPGVAHADELGYLFKMQYMPEDPTIGDQIIIDRITTMWTNFAKYSDPTPETTILLPVKWEPVTLGSPYHYLEINTQMAAHTRYEHRRMAFWDLFYKSYGAFERLPELSGDVDEDIDDEDDVVPDPDASGEEDTDVPDAADKMTLSLSVVFVVAFCNMIANNM